tara:strand:- start:10 stop:444 length:435 start_codon:yes stop_codon:yes gene_type:complete
MEEELSDVCPICYEQHNEDSISIKCGHKFHYKCIISSYKNMHNWKPNFYNSHNMSSNKVRECPYCRCNGGYLTLKEYTIPIENVHKEYSAYISYLKNGELDKISQYFDPLKCKSILKTGANKGCQCTKKKVEGDYCNRHRSKTS